MTCTAGTTARLLSHIFSLSVCIYAVVVSNTQYFINSTFTHYFTNNRIFVRPGFKVFWTRLKYPCSQMCQGGAVSSVFLFLGLPSHDLHCMISNLKMIDAYFSIKYVSKPSRNNKVGIDSCEIVKTWRCYGDLNIVFPVWLWDVQRWSSGKSFSPVEQSDA